MRQKGYKFLLSPNIVFYHHVRSDFKSMIRQKYENGKWIGITLKYCPKCFSIYHLIPMIFVLAIIFSIVMALTVTPFFLYILFGSYGLFNLVNLINIFVNNKAQITYLLIPFILFALHLAYGVGTIVGIGKALFAREKEK